MQAYMRVAMTGANSFLIEPIVGYQPLQKFKTTRQGWIQRFAKRANHCIRNMSIFERNRKHAATPFINKYESGIYNVGQK